LLFFDSAVPSTAIFFIVTLGLILFCMGALSCKDCLEAPPEE
jgi:hypothetical protein